MWPSTDSLWVLTSASPDEIRLWLGRRLATGDLLMGYPEEVDMERVEIPDGMKAVGVWWERRSASRRESMVEKELLRCQGMDIRSATVERLTGEQYGVVLKVYVMERHREIRLSGVRKLPDFEELMTAREIIFSEDIDAQKEFGRIHVELWNGAFFEFWADVYEMTP